nr:beta-galactosidase trimerization domain-containing protein [Mesorhizobium silamurunense]
MQNSSVSPYQLNSSRPWASGSCACVRATGSSPTSDLSRLKALYVPHWVMWKQEWNVAIEAFVRGGGTLILSALTGQPHRS